MTLFVEKGHESGRGRAIVVNPVVPAVRIQKKRKNAILETNLIVNQVCFQTRAKTVVNLGLYTMDDQIL